MEQRDTKPPQFSLDHPVSHRDDDVSARVAEAYYDSDDADRFYYNVWGGEDIHIGLYESESEPIAVASRRTVEHMAALLPPLTPRARIVDFGAGYGGAARYLARRFGARVTALNLSEVQNARHVELNRRTGLAQQVDVVHGAFERVPLSDATFDVVWSQDAFLHSSDREQVLREARRVLKPGGVLMFTDPMQADDCPDGVLQPVYERLHLSSLGSFSFYRRAAQRAGFREMGCHDMSGQLHRHYARVKAELTSRYDEIVRLASAEYVDRMLRGLQHWVDAGRAGHLAWGVLQFEASASP